jgi:hypothetical protein
MAVVLKVDNRSSRYFVTLLLRKKTKQNILHALGRRGNLQWEGQWRYNLNCRGWGGGGADCMLFENFSFSFAFKNIVHFS